MPRLAFSALQHLDLDLFEMVSGRIGFVHDLFLSFPYEVSDSLPEDGPDLVVLIDKRSRKEKIAELGAYPGRVVLVGAPGDAPFKTAYLPDRTSLPPNVVAAFVTSNELTDPRAVGVPLGVRVNKLRALKFVRQNRPPSREKLLYGNFTLNDEHYRPDRRGHPHIRARLVEELQDESWVDLDVSATPRDTPDQLIEYYSQMASHRFVLSPEGNGIDCYRTWEALYLGAIPIVMNSLSMTRFADLPFLFTDDYSELSVDYLERRWMEMSHRSYEINQMLRSHYFHRFLEEISRLEDPRFVCWGFESEKFLEVLSRSSRSAARIVTETPVPPFVMRGDLMRPAAWNTPGRLRLLVANGCLIVRAEGDGPTVAEIPLTTIAGGRFRLTGSIASEGTGDDDRLSLHVESRPETIAVATPDAKRSGRIDLPFVARSDRTVLAIRGPGEGPVAPWRIRDLVLRADL